MSPWWRRRRAEVALVMGSVAATLLALLVIEAIARLVIADRPAFAAERADAELTRSRRRACVDGRPWHTDGRHVAVVGESSAETIGSSINRLKPGSWEVVECGRSAMSLEELAARFDEVAGDRPDAVVVVFGHNLRFEYPVTDTQLALVYWRSQSRLLTWLASLRHHESRVVGSRRDAPEDARLALLDREYRRMAAVARSRGFRLVFTTMVSNLWVPPMDDLDPRSEARADLWEGRWDLATGALGNDAANAALERVHAAIGDFERGRTMLSRSLADPSELAHDADVSQARAWLQRALGEDHTAGRASPRGNELVRQIAGETHTLLRDSDRAYDGAYPYAGWQYLADHCHLRPAYMDAEAGAIIALLDSAFARGGAAETVSDRPPALHPTSFAEIAAERIRAITRVHNGPDDLVVGALGTAIEQRWSAEPIAREDRVAYVAALPSVAALAEPSRSHALALLATLAVDPARVHDLVTRALLAPSPAADLSLTCAVALRRSGDLAGARALLDRAPNDPAVARLRALSAR